MLKYRELIFWVFTLYSFIQPLTGQNFQNIGLDNQDKFIRLPEAFIIETQIDPESYFLGPGDSL